MAERPAGTCTAFTFPRIAVRDFAATNLARMPGLDDDPDNSWGAGGWAKPRERVRAKLTERKRPRALRRP
jgi:hypothetical protein